MILIYVSFFTDTPLSWYKSASNDIPCPDTAAMLLSLSPVQCADKCNSLGTSCTGFVYNFTDPVPQFPCHIKAEVCEKTQTQKRVKFF